MKKALMGKVTVSTSQSKKNNIIQQNKRMINNVSEQNKVIRNYNKTTGLKVNGGSKSPIRAVTGKKGPVGQSKQSLADVKNEFNMF